MISLSLICRVCTSVAVFMASSYASSESSSVLSPNSHPIPLPIKLRGADFPLSADAMESIATTPTAPAAGPIGLLRFRVVGLSVLTSSSSSSFVSSVLGQVCLLGLAKCGRYEDCVESDADSIMSNLVIVAMSDSRVSVMDISPCLSRMQLW